MKFKIDFAWIVLFGPMCIVVFLSIFELPDWFVEQSSEGARMEAEGHSALGRSALKNGNLEEAANQFMTALTIDETFAEPYMSLGVIFNMRGEYDRAIKYMEKSIELDTLNKERVYNNLGMVYANREDYKSALVMFRKALVTDTVTAAVYRNIGETGFVLNDWELAADAFLKAIDNKPSVAIQYHSMRQEALSKYRDKDNYDKIKEYFSRGLSDDVLSEYDAQIVDELALKDPKLADDYMNLARACMKLDNIDEATASYERALKITPEDAVLRNRLGIAYARSGDLKKAHTQFSEAVRLNPGYEDARFNLERCESKLK